MRSFALIALFSFSAQVHAEEPAVTDMNDELANKLVQKLANKLVEASFLQNAPLDTTMLGKPGTQRVPAQRAAPGAAGGRRAVPTQGRQGDPRKEDLIRPL